METHAVSRTVAMGTSVVACRKSEIWWLMMPMIYDSRGQEFKPR